MNTRTIIRHLVLAQKKLDFSKERLALLGKVLRLQRLADTARQDPGKVQQIRMRLEEMRRSLSAREL